MTKKAKISIVAAVSAALLLGGSFIFFKDDIAQKKADNDILPYRPTSEMQHELDVISADLMTETTQAAGSASPGTVTSAVADTTATLLPDEIRQSLIDSAQSLNSAYPNVIGWLYIEAKATVSEYIPTSEILCKQAEINRAIDNGTKTAEEIRSDIFRLAELKYKNCTYSDISQKTEPLKSLLADKTQLNTLDTGLLRSCVKQITVSHSCIIEAEFINGVIIKNEIERGDENGDST